MHTIKKVLQAIAANIIALPALGSMCRALFKTLSVSESLTQRIPVTKSFPVLIGEGTFTYHSSMYDAVGRVLYWQGFNRYEYETMKVFMELVKHANTFVDIGANTGIFSLAASAMNTQISVYAFEPVPTIYEKLIENLRSNNLLLRVHPNKMAISNSVGDVPFHVPQHNMSSGSLNLQGAHNLIGRVETVPCTTLDQYVIDNTLQGIDLVKIDVEGFEHLVLEGAREVLERHQPSIICECLPGCNSNVIETILGKQNYRLYILTDAGPVEMTHIEPDDSLNFKNYLFAPATRDHR